jgi:CheY-like chemotaxis protein
VLLVDDSDETRECMALVLNGLGARVTSTSSARSALAAFDAEPPDVILSDLAMPEQDGLQLIGEIRRRRQRARVPAAALTAYARPEEAERALLAGFDLHLAKPVREDALLAAVLELKSRSGAVAAS